MATATQQFDAAIDRIDAVKLADGRYAYYADETDQWYVVTRYDINFLVLCMTTDDETVSDNAYSHWCAGTSAIEMPNGWSPDDDR